METELEKHEFQKFIRRLILDSLMFAEEDGKRILCVKYHGEEAFMPVRSAPGRTLTKEESIQIPKLPEKMTDEELIANYDRQDVRMYRNRDGSFALHCKRVDGMLEWYVARSHEEVGV